MRSILCSYPLKVRYVMKDLTFLLLSHFSFHEDNMHVYALSSFLAYQYLVYYSPTIY